ncbi:Hypothetical protein, putative [Bodo saltans]|uniref:Transmembrane protein n=1 Tax=Bodo saltans TaxID=75058 RepID=A0A0S4IQX0_BODSA|nr:Hypothetical protein, putative [Bodo saltans]|eukprot:CUE72442.1 Hypothetical protein, putative [Bodo saltans]
MTTFHIVLCHIFLRTAQLTVSLSICEGRYRMTEAILSSTHPMTGNNGHHQLPNFNAVSFHGGGQGHHHHNNAFAAKEGICDEGEQVNPQTISSTTYAWRIERHWFPLLRYIYFSNSEHPDGNVPHNHKSVQQQYADQPPQGAGAGASATTTKSRKDDDEGHVRLLQTTASTSDLNHHAASAFISVHEAEMSSVAPGGAMAGSSFAMHKGKKGTHNVTLSFAAEGVQNSRHSLRTRVSPVTEAEFAAYFCSSRFNSLVDCFAASVFVAGGAVQYLVQDRTSLLPGIGNGAVAVAKLLLGITTWWVWKHQGRANGQDNGGRTSFLDKLWLLFSFRSHRNRADARDVDGCEYSEGETSAASTARGEATTTIGNNGRKDSSSSSSQHHQH